MLSGPGPPPPPPPHPPPPMVSPAPSPAPCRGRPLLPAVEDNRKEPTQTRGREDDGEWSQPVLLHRSGEPHQSRDRAHHWQGEKEQHHILCGNKHVTMTLLLTKRQQPYHTSVEHTAPHRRGGANQKDHRSHSTGEGTRPNKTRREKQQAHTRQLPTWPGKGGYHGEGGGGRRGVAALHHIYIYDWPPSPDSGTDSPS